MNLAHWLLPSQGRLSAPDLELFARLGGLLPEGWRVGHLHPARSEQRALPRFEAVSERAWDLKRRTTPRYDALVVARLPGFSAHTEQPFRSALASCRCLVVLSSDAGSNHHARLLGSLRVAEGQLRVYQGDLTDPLLRVDDYPTGVRPILEDLSSIHDVLSHIDGAGLPFHLGIVPGILEDRMVDFLVSLQHLVVSMHGFDHGYPKFSRVLLEANDPFNQRGTVGGFDEFRGRDYPEILAALEEGRRILESRLGQAPRSYVPPNNIASRRTGRALLAAGFEYVLTERAIPDCELPCIGSDFYARSSEFRAESLPNVATLHATWEADLRRAGDTDSLPNFLTRLVEQRSRARQQVTSVAERIVTELARG